MKLLFPEWSVGVRYLWVETDDVFFWVLWYKGRQMEVISWCWLSFQTGMAGDLKTIHLQWEAALNICVFRSTDQRCGGRYKISLLPGYGETGLQPVEAAISWGATPWCCWLHWHGLPVCTWVLWTVSLPLACCVKLLSKVLLNDREP